MYIYLIEYKFANNYILKNLAKLSDHYSSYYADDVTILYDTLSQVLPSNSYTKVIDYGKPIIIANKDFNRNTIQTIRKKFLELYFSTIFKYLITHFEQLYVYLRFNNTFAYPIYSDSNYRNGSKSKYSSNMIDIKDLLIPHIQSAYCNKTELLNINAIYSNIVLLDVYSNNKIIRYWNFDLISLKTMNKFKEALNTIENVIPDNILTELSYYSEIDSIHLLCYYQNGAFHLL